MGNNPTFPSGRGTVFMHPPSGDLNNPTSTKQQVNSTTGLVVGEQQPTDVSSQLNRSAAVRHHHTAATTPPPTTPPPTTPPPTTPPPTTPPPTTPPPTTPPPGGQLEFSPIGDTHVKSDKPNSSYGNETYVRLRGTANNDYDSYFKFNITGTGGQVSGAVLRLYSYDGGPDGGTIYRASNNYLNSSTPWAENGLNWTNAPGPTGAALDSAGNVPSNSWIELDVSAAITGDGTVSFVLTTNNSNSVFYYSKEAADFRPRLEISTGSGLMGLMLETAPSAAQRSFFVEDPDTPEPELTPEPTEVTPEPVVYSLPFAATSSSARAGPLRARGSTTRRPG